MEAQEPTHHTLRDNERPKPVPFRHLIPSKDWYRLHNISTSSARQWYEDHKDIPPLQPFLSGLQLENISRPYHGLTADGVVVENLFHYAADEGAPVAAMVECALRLISSVSPAQKAAALFESVEVDELRVWSNPEFYINEGGLRLDECASDIQKAVHDILRSSVSSAGYDKILGCCGINGFLGELVNGAKVFNVHSYNFRIFGSPDLVAPWAFTFFGHHVCMAVFVQGTRMVIGPTFLGAEPNYIDKGPYAGLYLFSKEETLALQLVRSLSPEIRRRTILYDSVLPSKLPPGRWKPHDERHVGGAGQDNCVVPYEGCPVSLFNPTQKNFIVKLFMAFNEYYPCSVLSHRLTTFLSYLDKTYFAWIGGIGDHDAYYFRIHSPVAFMEFDFHSGVYLTNEEPAKCHIHTINRTPNKGDYGKALLKQYHEESPK